MSEAKRKKPTLKEQVEQLNQQINMMQEIIDKADESKRNMFIHFTDKISESQEKMKMAIEGLKETKDAMSAILIRMASEHGQKQEDGSFKIEINKPSIADLNLFTTETVAVDNKYVITVRMKDEQVQE